MLALVGSACGVDPLVCGLRAVAGAAVLYVMTRLAGRIVLGIAADAFVRSRLNKEANRDHRSQ